MTPTYYMTPDTSKGAARRLRQLITQVGHRRSQVLRTAARGAAINPTPSLPGGQRARHMRTRNLIPIRVSPRARLKVMTRIEEFDENQNTDHLYEQDDIDYSTDLSDIDEEPTVTPFVQKMLCCAIEVGCRANCLKLPLTLTSSMNSPYRTDSEQSLVLSLID
jgi:hypothetical protein